MSKIKLLIFTALLAGSSIFAQESAIIFPKAFAFAIDDMGWNIGNDSGDVDGQGPYRIGVDRTMDVNNYKAIVEVGKAVGVRIQGLFVLAEMDRENILAQYPSTTWQGSNWDNSKNVGQEQLDIMKYVQDNAAYLEFGLHGVGHEHWVDGKKNRAEWYSTDDNKPWSEDIMKIHIQCFKDIMGQYGLTPENGQSFPESFVPCAYGYYWNPQGDYSTGSIVAGAGVKYVNTLFDYIRELNPPEGANGGGFDNGVVVVNRINYGNHWYALSSLPTVDLADQESDIIESHWSNWLAQDDFLQEATTNKWIAYYEMVQASPNRYIAKNTEQFHSQWLYNKYTKVSESEKGMVNIDNSVMPAEYYAHGILGNMVLKVKLDEGQHVSKALLNNAPVASYFEEAGFGYIYLPTLESDNYVFEYEVSDQSMPFYVMNKGTYNVYQVVDKKKSKTINIRSYGLQTIDVVCDSPKSIHSENKNLSIVESNYNEEDGVLSLSLKALDMQGETGIIRLSY